MTVNKPLTGLRVVEIASGVAAAQAGRLLSLMGAETIMVEPPTCTPLRREPPFLDTEGCNSALFTYLAVGKHSVLLDLTQADGQAQLDTLLSGAAILIDDTPLADRAARGLDQDRIATAHPDLVHLSVLPFGAHGPKSGWKGEELNLVHAGGEGFLLPNGLTADIFPERPPLKIAGHFAEMQGGVTAALAGLSALWAGHGQYVDASVQDANVAVGAFAVQRYGDGSVEHRLSRSFRYGGVIQCRDGYVELLTLEERQWLGLVDLMGGPEWAREPDLQDAAGRSARGDEINQHIRDWARTWPVEDLVAKAQTLGVPMARYNTPDQVLAGAHENARGIFHDVPTPSGATAKVQSLPFRFGSNSLPCDGAVPEPGADQALLTKFSPVKEGAA